MLTRVTITGADSKTAPEELFSFSQEYPFLEWGLLYSEQKRGEPRYPGHLWFQHFLRLFRENRKVHVAIHLCGQPAREIQPMEVFLGLGAESWSTWAEHGWRVQLNGFSPSDSVFHGGKAAPETRLHTLSRWKSYRGAEFILQMSQRERAVEYAELAAELPRASVLCDASGGRGVQIQDFPVSPHPKVRFGYAGGISLDTIEKVLDATSQQEAETWIDMESGVRTADQFDLQKVREILKRAAPHIRKG